VDEPLARHVVEAAEALRRFLESEAGDVPALPHRPRPAPVQAPRSALQDVAGPARPALPPRPGARPQVPPPRPGHPAGPQGSVPQYGAPFLEEGPALPGDLDALEALVKACTCCPLHATRAHTVFGEGSRDRPIVMFVGEGPGADEDRTGRPFVGAAGQLLDKMIAAMGLRREDCYIANVVKCRPPENATPTPDQAGHCLPYLEAQIRVLRPRFLVALGAAAAHALTGSQDGVARQRGRVQRRGDIPLVVTYHPAALLRNAEYKRPAWADLQLVMARLRNG